MISVSETQVNGLGKRDPVIMRYMNSRVLIRLDLVIVSQTNQLHISESCSTLFDSLSSDSRVSKLSFYVWSLLLLFAAYNILIQYEYIL